MLEAVGSWGAGPTASSTGLVVIAHVRPTSRPEETTALEAARATIRSFATPMRLSAALNTGYLLRVALDRPRLAELDENIGEALGLRPSLEQVVRERLDGGGGGGGGATAGEPFGGRILAFVRGTGVERVVDRFWWQKAVHLQNTCAAVLRLAPHRTL